MIVGICVCLWAYTCDCGHMCVFVGVCVCLWAYTCDCGRMCVFVGVCVCLWAYLPVNGTRSRRTAAGRPAAERG